MRALQANIEQVVSEMQLNIVNSSLKILLKGRASVREVKQPHKRNRATSLHHKVLQFKQRNTWILLHHSRIHITALFILLYKHFVYLNILLVCH